jgi:hypothetical protein
LQIAPLTRALPQVSILLDKVSLSDQVSQDLREHVVSVVANDYLPSVSEAEASSGVDSENGTHIGEEPSSYATA